MGFFCCCWFYLHWARVGQCAWCRSLQSERSIIWAIRDSKEEKNRHTHMVTIWRDCHLNYHKSDRISVPQWPAERARERGRKRVRIEKKRRSLHETNHTIWSSFPQHWCCMCCVCMFLTVLFYAASSKSFANELPIFRPRSLHCISVFLRILPSASKLLVDLFFLLSFVKCSSLLQIKPLDRRRSILSIKWTEVSIGRQKKMKENQQENEGKKDARISKKNTQQTKF